MKHVALADYFSWNWRLDTTERIIICYPMSRQLFVIRPTFQEIYTASWRWRSYIVCNGSEYAEDRAIANLLFDVVDTVDCTVDEEWASLSIEDKPEHFLHLGFGTYLKVYKYNEVRFYDVRRY